ncbi:MAG: tyrosine-protein phosphatase, partial [Kiritimatiellae bacterium]|nr:tyrosine-protein phosphatase [Kiritimatiellia bacterium]
MKRLSAISFAAALLLSWGAAAAPTIVSPADYAAVSTMTAKFKGYLDDPDFTTSYFNYTDYGQPNSVRVAQRYESYSNSAPVTVSWSGSSGTCTVKLWRTHKDSASNPVFTTTTTGTSVSFYDLEIGRNYTWSVTDGNGTATGHFYTLRNAPRMINSQNPDTPGAECSNGRDMGGRLTADGTKAIRQGLIFRTAQLEYCNPRDTTTGVYGEMQWLKNTLGIKLDVDLRDKSHLLENYVGTGQGTNDNPARAYCGEYNFRYTWKNNSILTSINESSIGEGITRFCVSATTGRTFPSWDGFFSTDANKKAVWYAFDAIYESVKKGEPLVFHCSHGKDRGGTLAFVLHGVLGVTKAEAIKDFGISWFDNPDETLNFNTITTKIVNKLAEYTGDTLQQQCAAYLAQCGQKYGLTLSAAQAKVADFQALMLEDIEAADGGDTFAYTDFYFRRAGGGGSFGSEDSSGRLNYMFKTLTSDATSNKRLSSEMGYGACYYFWPTKNLPYARPVCGYEKAGKVVISAADAATESTGPYNFKVYFTSDGHTMADRTVIEQRAGIGDFENVDLYFTTYDSSQLGENGLSLPYVYSGTAAIEVWANATMRVRDLRDMSQKHKSSKKYKAYVKFPSGNCDNARFEVLETDVGAENLLGWFTGGQAGTTQHLKVGGAILQFNATGKTSGVDGALVLEFELGSANTTSTAAMLKIAGALKVNAGSSIVVDAGGKGAGTYKLVQAGTLTDNANLPANATVTNCKSGYYGTVVKSGNNLNLVIAAGTPPSTDIAITASAAYVTYPSPKFTVSGTVAVGEGTTTATLHYTLGGGTEQTLALALGADGSFSADIPYASAGDTLVWRVIAENVNGGATATGATAATTTARAADSAATTYVWTGAAGDGKWTTLGNWTSASTTAYGYPANGTYATAEFPASLTEAFTCTVDQNVAVQSLYVLSPNIRLVLADKTLTVNGTSGSYTSYSFGNVADGNPSIAFSGANAALVSAKSSVRANYGYISDNGGASGVCTVQYVVPASGWTSTAPVRTTGSDSKVLFYHNVKLSIDATALGVPAAGETKTVYLASGTDAPGVYQLGTVEITCAAGAQGAVSVSNNKLVLSVTASSAIPAASVETLLADKAYTGANQTSGLADTSAYTVTADAGGTDAGDYTVTVAPNAGYTWDDESTAARTFTWSIVPAENAWTTTPSITKAAWTTDATSGALTAGATQFGTPSATIAKDGGASAAFSGTLPTEAGEYVITYTSAATANWLAPSPASMSVSFTIAAPASPPEPGEITVTLFDEHPEWGYKVEGLGAGRNETALVFTNQAATMSWTVPANLENVRFLVVGGGGGGGADINPSSGSSPFLGGGGGGG